LVVALVDELAVPLDKPAFELGDGSRAGYRGLALPAALWVERRVCRWRPVHSAQAGRLAGRFHLRSRVAPNAPAHQGALRRRVADEPAVRQDFTLPVAGYCESAERGADLDKFHGAISCDCYASSRTRRRKSAAMPSGTLQNSTERNTSW